MKMIVNTLCGTKRRICTFMKKNQTIFLKLCLADALIKLMALQDYDTINVNTICKVAGVGRTTFYRHLNHQKSKDELLMFKLNYEWEYYAEQHEEDVKKDKGFAMLNYIYENKRLFTLLNNNGLVTLIMHLFEQLIPAEEIYDKSLSYLMSFFSYGYFGVVYQWIKYDFDETPEQIKKHIIDTLSSGMKNPQDEK